MELEEKRKDHMGGRDGGRKFPGKTYFPLCIEYPATILLVAL